MKKTLGYVLLENYFRKLESWPTSKGFRGFGIIFFLTVTVLWAWIPCIDGFKNFTADLYINLIRIAFMCIGLSSISMNIQILYKKRDIFKLILALSDFDTFGRPARLESLDKLIRSTIKFTYWITALVIHLISVNSLLHEHCYIGKNIDPKCGEIIPYYIPFCVNAWQKTVLILYKTITFTPILCLCTAIVIFYSYCIELLIIRLEHIKSIIGDIRFVPEQKKNLKFRRAIVYYLDVLRLFKFTANTVNILFLPQRFAAVILAAFSSAGFLIQKDYFSVLMFISALIFILSIHTVGQRLINASSSLSEAIYNLNWYDANVNIQKDVLIFLCITQRTFVVELGILGIMSYEVMLQELSRIYMWCNCIIKFLSRKNLSP